MNIRRIRDVSLLDTEPRLLIAADSQGSIGQKPEDALQVPAILCGYFLARVPLMEIVCLGGKPFSFVLTSSNEMHPTAQEMLQGVRQAFHMFGLSDQAINGSSEENMPTRMTAAGITILGEVPDGWKEPTAQPGETLYLLGKPLFGSELLEQTDTLIQPHQLLALRSDPNTGLMIPLGSGGIASEILQLEQEGYHLESNTLAELTHSAGPATAILFSSKRQDFTEIYERIPLKIVGRFK